MTFVQYGNTITTNIDETSKITNFIADVNSVVTVTPNPDHGYEWNTNTIIVNDNNVAGNSFNTSNIDNIVEVIFTAIVYDITYTTAVGELVAPIVDKYTIEDEIVLPAVQLKSSDDPFYAFEGWFDNNGDEWEVIPVGTTGNLDFTAKWTRSALELEIVRLWNHTLAVSNPLQRPELNGANYKWFKDVAGTWELLDNGGKATVTFAEEAVPNGDYKVEIYIGSHNPIVIETTIADAQLRVYPTAMKTNEVINVEADNANVEDFKVNVFTLGGQAIPAEINIDSNSIKVSGINQAGVYILKVTMSDDTTNSYKIVVTE